MAIRGHLGHWCGYIVVPRSHFWHTLDYDAIDCDIHGGLTYCGNPDTRPEALDLLGPGDWATIGFDCAHYTDIVPGQLALAARYGFSPPPFMGYEVYRDLNYVRTETEHLADQMIKAGREGSIIL